MQQLIKRFLLALSCTALLSSAQVFSETTLFGSETNNSSSSALSPDAFKKQVQTLSKQTNEKLSNEASQVLPNKPTDSSTSLPAKPSQAAPARSVKPQAAPSPAPKNKPQDVYTGFGGSTPPKPRQQPQQPQQPAPSGGGWNINY